MQQNKGQAKIERVSTGVAGLDEILQGGFAKNRVVLVAGEPGSGKTIMTIQFLVNGIKKGQKALFVCMEETKVHLYREMSHFGWDLSSYESEGKFAFIDATPLRLLPEKITVEDVAIDRKEFSMITLTQAVNREIERMKPDLLAVDPLTSLMLQYAHENERRSAILELVTMLSNTGATCLMTSELKAAGFKRRLETEEFLSHGAILLFNEMVSGSVVRVIQVQKMREIKCDTQPRPYVITPVGLEVFPKESVYK